jgi:hypothetical protein
MTENMGTSFLDGGDAVDLDIEVSWSGGNTDDDPGGCVLGKVAGIDRVDSGKLLDGSAIHIALEDVFQR